MRQYQNSTFFARLSKNGRGVEVITVTLITRFLQNPRLFVTYSSFRKKMSHRKHSHEVKEIKHVSWHCEVLLHLQIPARDSEMPPRTHRLFEHQRCFTSFQLPLLYIVHIRNINLTNSGEGNFPPCLLSVFNLTYSLHHLNQQERWPRYSHIRNMSLKRKNTAGNNDLALPCQTQLQKVRYTEHILVQIDQGWP